MRKSTAMLLGMLLAGATAAQADFLGLKDWKFDGSLEVLGNQANNEEDANDGAKDSRGNTITRVRLGADMGITDDVTGRVELVRGSFGLLGDNTQYGQAPTSLNDEQDKIRVQNAYIDLTSFLAMDKIRLGRQYVGRRGDLLVFAGPANDDLMTTLSFDALSVWKKFGPVQATFVTGKVLEDDGVPGTTTDTDADGDSPEINVTYGILSSDELIKNDAFKIPLELGYYQGTNAQDETAPSDNITLTILDLRAGFKGLNDRLSVMAEYAINGGQQNTGAGTETDYKGDAIVLTGAWDDAERGFGVDAVIANATGDDNLADGKDESFRDFNAVSGGNGSTSDMRFGEIFSNSNTFGKNGGLDTGNEGNGLNIMGLGGYYVLPVMENKVKLMADYYMYKLNEVGPGQDDKLGNELDLAVNYAHSENVVASAGYAMLMADDGLAVAKDNPLVGDDTVTKLWAKISLKWGDQQ